MRLRSRRPHARPLLFIARAHALVDCVDIRRGIVAMLDAPIVDRRADTCCTGACIIAAALGAAQRGPGVDTRGPTRAKGRFTRGRIAQHRSTQANRRVPARRIGSHEIPDAAAMRGTRIRTIICRPAEPVAAAVAGSEASPQKGAAAGAGIEPPSVRTPSIARGHAVDIGRRRICRARGHWPLRAISIVMAACSSAKYACAQQNRP